MPIIYTRGNTLRYTPEEKLNSSVVGKWITFTIKRLATDPDPGLLQYIFQAPDELVFQQQRVKLEIPAVIMEAIPVGEFVYDIQIVEDLPTIVVDTIDREHKFTCLQDVTLTTSIPIIAGLPQVLSFVLPTVYNVDLNMPVTTFTYANATHYMFTSTSAQPALGDGGWLLLSVYSPVIVVGGEGSYQRWAWVKNGTTVSPLFAPQTCSVDLPSSIQFSSSSVNLAEGAQVNLVIPRPDNTYGALVVAVGVAGGTAVNDTDYSYTPKTLSWSSNDTANKSVTITATADGLTEGAESAVLRLTVTSGQAVYGANRSITINIQDSSAGLDTTPDQFQGLITPTVSAAVNTLITGAAFTPVGYTNSTTISVNTGSYSLDGGTTWLTAASQISPGQSVTPRLQSSTSNSSPTYQTITIGGVPGTFSVTTVAAAGSVSVTSISVAQIDHGVEFDITGSGFATVPTIAPLVWDDCTGIIPQDLWDDVRPIAAADPNYRMAYRAAHNGIVAAHQRNGGKIMSGAHYATDANGWNVLAGKSFTPPAFPYYIRMRALCRVAPGFVFTGANNFKTMAIGNTGSVYGSGSGGYWYVNYNSNSFSSASSVPSHVLSYEPTLTLPDMNGHTQWWNNSNNMAAAWVDMVFEIRMTDQLDGYIKCWENNGPLLIDYLGRTDDWVSTIRTLGFGGYSEMFGQIENFRAFMDQHLDLTRARVELTNNAVYTASTIVEPQPRVSWADGTLRVKGNLGRLSNGQTAYLHITRHDGVRMSSGFAVTCGV